MLSCASAPITQTAVLPRYPKPIELYVRVFIAAFLCFVFSVRCASCRSIATLPLWGVCLAIAVGHRAVCYAVLGVAKSESTARPCCWLAWFVRPPCSSVSRQTRAIAREGFPSFMCEDALTGLEVLESRLTIVNISAISDSSVEGDMGEYFVSHACPRFVPSLNGTELLFVSESSVPLHALDDGSELAFRVRPRRRLAQVTQGDMRW